MTTTIARLMALAIIIGLLAYGHPAVRAQISCGQKGFTSQYYIGCIGGGVSSGGGGGGGGGMCSGVIDYSSGCSPMLRGI